MSRLAAAYFDQAAPSGWCAIFGASRAFRGRRQRINLLDILLFFTKAGAFVFGIGLAVVAFLPQGVVQDFHWLNEQQFTDAMAVVMITRG